jgi:hypothetical protein
VISVENQEQMPKQVMRRRAMNTVLVDPMPPMLPKRKPSSGAQLSKPLVSNMSERTPIVYIVDDDEVTRNYFDAVSSEAHLTSCRVESHLCFSKYTIAASLAACCWMSRCPE